ncbi:PEP-CTERM system TPR-repeat protein PrsT [Pseudothauera nasutitermitis]|uniref:PEP-CTERM system TPR-repeat protein PrsT n=1 Tax=Pseudothauera nasutitermitis TaxID=2565930 RepID=A0A4V3WC30_9RHOO|nr:XrtA/PEP-CTERM system TPR-repeat protein PrsT [Pseudothauera nasutitermitis]THF65525.1 PEP-CTERM system TPR-repeat protein PrsT [Pseudothauera nasutitermitis]
MSFSMSAPRSFSPSGRRHPAATLLGMLLAGALLAGCGDSPDKLVDSARTYIERQDLQAASIQLKNALQQDGALAEARFLLGQVNFGLGDMSGAARELQRAEELGYPAERIAPLLSTALVRTGEFDRVIDRYAATRFAEPSAQARVSGALGTAYLGKARLPEARAAYEVALAAASDDTEARLGLARTRLFSDDLDGARREVDAVIAQTPDNADAHALRAQIQIAAGQQDDALKALAEAVRVRPDAVAYRYELVGLLLGSGREDEARAQIEALRAHSPDSPATRFLLALMAHRDGQETAAREDVQRALRDAPDFLPAHLLAGSVLFRLGDHQQAQTHLARVLDRLPGHRVARQQLALSQIAAGQGGRALETLKPLIDAAPEDARSLTVIGQALLAAGDFERAAEYFERAAKAAPDSPGARLRLGVARVGTGDLSEGLADLEVAASMDGAGIQADTALVLARLRANDQAGALKAADALVARHPDNAEAHNLRGGVHMARRDWPAARADFGKALELRPDLLAAVINLARVDIAEQRLEGLEARFDAFHQAHPANVDAYVAHADLKTAAGAPPAEVLAVLERGLGAVPGAQPIRLAMVRELLRAGDARRALAAAQEAAAANPNNPSAVEALARAQLAVGEHQQAISSYGRLAGLLPASPAPLIEQAGAQLSMRDLAGAEQSLRRAIAVQPDAPLARARLAAVLADQQRFDDALALAREMQGRAALVTLGNEIEGEVHMRRGEWEAALAAFRKAAGQAPRAELIAKQHAALSRAGRGAEANRLAAEWLRAQPRDTVLRVYLAEQALNAERLDEAAQRYREVLAITPENALVLNNLAWVAGRRGEKEAVALAERALELSPGNPVVLDTLGMLQIERGQAEQGLANLNRAVSLAPALPQLRLNLAKAYLKLERRSDAVGTLDALLGQLPADSPVHREAAALRATL